MESPEHEEMYSKKVDVEDSPGKSSEEGETQDMIYRVLLDLFETSCDLMVTFLRKKRTRMGICKENPELNNGYYEITTWPEALFSSASSRTEEETEEDDNIEMAFPMVQYVSMEEHRSKTVEATKNMRVDDWELAMMYQGDCFLQELIEEMSDYISVTDFDGEAPPFIAIFKLIQRGPPEPDNPIRMNDLLSSTIRGPNKVIAKMLDNEEEERARIQKPYVEAEEEEEEDPLAYIDEALLDLIS